VIGQIVKTVMAQKLKMAEHVGQEVHLTFVDEDDVLVLENIRNKQQFNEWSP